MPEFNNPTTTLSYLEKGDKLMGGSPSEFANILADNVFNRSLTRSTLQTLITASELIIGQKYTITNAVGSTLSLVVEAVSVNKLDEVAVNSTDGENYKYDITADTAILIANPIALGSANQILGVNNGATAQEYKTLSGTANQVTITNSVNGVTFSLPQSIATSSSPTFAGLTLTSALSVANGGTGLSSTPTNGQLDIGNGTGFTRATLTGTANQVVITNAAGSITLSLPQSIASTSSPTFAGLTLTSALSVANGGTGLATTPTNGQIDIGNGTNFTRATITGTANQVTVTNGAGTITLSLPQAIATTSSVIFGYLNLGTGSLSFPPVALGIIKTLTGSSALAACVTESTIASDVTSSAQGFRVAMSTQAATFTAASIINYQSGFGTKGSGSTITDFTGFNASDSSVATNTYGFKGNINSGSGKWNIYMNGTANNYLNGNLQIGSATPTAGAEKLQVTGTASISGALSIGNTVQASVATPSTHKVTIVIGGVTYYLLATNV